MLKDKPAKSDDYCLSDLIDMKDKSADLDSLMNIYTDAGTYSPTVEALLGGDPTLILPNLKRSPKEQIDKLMMHPTKARTTSHDWSPILRILFPKLVPIIEEVRRKAK
jgi:hypothetical protein